MYTHTHVHVHAHTRTHIHVHTDTHTHTHTRSITHTCTHMYCHIIFGPPQYSDLRPKVVILNLGTTISSSLAAEGHMNFHSNIFTGHKTMHVHVLSRSHTLAVITGIM